MDIILVPLLRLIIRIVSLYKFFIMVYVAIGWLESFKIINPYNHIVYTIHTFLFKLIEPVLIPIRKFMPNLGTVDIAPVILFLLIYFIEEVLSQLSIKFPL